jgi:hypothetical protein
MLAQVGILNKGLERQAPLLLLQTRVIESHKHFAARVWTLFYIFLAVLLYMLLFVSAGS